MITDERLQEITRLMDREYELEYHDIHLIKELVDELISAIKAVDVDAYNKEYKMIVDENQELQQYKAEMEIQIIDLRAQLAEAKSVLIGQREDRRFDRKRLVKIAKKNHSLQNELDEVKSKAWKTVDLEEGNMLVFVGVHVVAWQQEWGKPSVGFTRWNDD